MEKLKCPVCKNTDLDHYDTIERNIDFDDKVASEYGYYYCENCHTDISVTTSCKITDINYKIESYEENVLN